MPMILNEVTWETGQIAAHVYAGGTLIESKVWEGGDSTYAVYLTGEYNAASIAELRDQLGNSLFSLDYPDVYGPANPRVSVGALAPGYIGEFYDTESHLQFLRARWYDPTLGIFISQDQIDGDLGVPFSYINRYRYADNAPLSNIDRTGDVIIAVLAPGLIGGSGSALWSITYDYVVEGEVDWGAAGAAFVEGFASAYGGWIRKAVVAAVSTAVQTRDPWETAGSTLIAAALGSVGKLGFGVRVAARNSVSRR